MAQITLTNLQARRFLLKKHGLIGEHLYEGKDGTLACIRDLGCIQYDPVDVCGKNPELVLQSRVKHFKKTDLYELLYGERQLIDYWDKNMAIYPVEDWAYFNRERLHYREIYKSKTEIDKLKPLIREYLKENPYVCSKDFKDLGKVDWYWTETSLARAAMEAMYYDGELIIHHKKNTQRYYSLAQDHLPEDIHQARDPHEDSRDYYAWRVLRRIASLGLLWNKASDAWLGIRGFKAADRNRGFADLLETGAIFQVVVEGISEPLYCDKAYKPLLERVMAENPVPLSDEGAFEKRIALIAPLDNLMWDRKLIKAIFNFDYKWEIYTPDDQRLYGHYVLPLLYGTDFIGRMALHKEAKTKTLMVDQLWLEPESEVLFKKKAHKKSLDQSLNQYLKEFATFNGMDQVKWHLEGEA